MIQIPRVISDREFIEKMDLQYQKLYPGYRAINSVKHLIGRAYVPSSLLKVIESPSFYYKFFTDKSLLEVDPKTITPYKERIINRLLKMYRIVEKVATVIYAVGENSEEFWPNKLSNLFLREENEKIPYCVYEYFVKSGYFSDKLGILTCKPDKCYEEGYIHFDNNLNPKEYEFMFFGKKDTLFEKFAQAVALQKFRYYIESTYTYNELRERGLTDRQIAGLNYGMEPDVTAKVKLGYRARIKKDIRIPKSSYLIENSEKLYIHASDIRTVRFYSEKFDLFNNDGKLMIGFIILNSTTINARKEFLSRQVDTAIKAYVELDIKYLSMKKRFAECFVDTMENLFLFSSLISKEIYNKIDSIPKTCSLFVRQVSELDEELGYKLFKLFTRIVTSKRKLVSYLTPALVSKFLAKASFENNRYIVEGFKFAIAPRKDQKIIL